MKISASPAENSARLHVLIVDDEPLIRWSMAETLAHAGCDVSEAGSAKETLQRLSAGPRPDVILLDYRMPDSNDLKLLETIRQTVPNSPVIMVTAYGTPDVLAGAAKLGVYRVLSKPLDMHDLAPLVQQASASRFH